MSIHVVILENMQRRKWKLHIVSLDSSISLLVPSVDSSTKRIASAKIKKSNSSVQFLFSFLFQIFFFL